MFNVCADGEAWRGGRVGYCVVPGSAPCISFGSMRSAQHADMLRLSRSGTTTIVDVYLPTDRPGIVLHCLIDLRSQDLRSHGLRSNNLSRLRQHVHQTANNRSSALAIAGMMLLLGVCGWIVGGTEGVRRAVTGGEPQPNGLPISHEAMYRWFGARLLRPADLPGLFNILAHVCRRAGLCRLPDLYCLAAPNDMNAYALGGPQRGAIVLTEGLLRGMTPGEITGILAHEVAHIRNNDAWAMGWAGTLHRAIEWTSLTGLALLRAQNRGIAAERPLAALLSAAPAIGRLLGLALSRIRELDADATALELTGDLAALVAALGKLERHHGGARVLRADAFEDDPMRLLRSHPATSERVGALHSLAH